MSMTKGDYQTVAAAVQESDLDDREAFQLALILADKFVAGNPRFLPHVFVAQCLGKDRLDDDDLHDLARFSAALELRVKESLTSFTWR